MHTPSDGLQDLLARLIGQAHELGSRGIYRGEPEPFGRISSGLYRQLYEIDDQYFDINSAQRRWIERARQYAPYLSDDDVLTSLQHLGGKTNLIDFTRDLNIALFFASYHSPDKDGRVILMEKPLVSRDQGDVIAPYKLLERGTPANMTDVQKSLWVEPEKGYIDEEHVTTVKIPSALKPEILSHLRVVYGIEASTVYNDLSGFIRDQDRLRDPEAEWHAGVRASEAGEYEGALRFFAHYEQLVDAPALDLHYYRGISSWYADRREEALADIAAFRSGFPRDPRAFPEEMESAYAERIDRDAGAAATEVFPGFRVRLVGDAATPVGAELEIGHGPGQWSAQELDKKEAYVTFPALPPEIGGTWEFSLLNPDGYQGVDSHPIRWPVRETLVLEAIDHATPDLKVEIESLEYTYKAGIEGPLITYPASVDGGARRQAGGGAGPEVRGRLE